MLKELQAFANSLANSSMDKETSMLDMTIDTYRGFGVENLPALIEQVNNTDNKKVSVLLEDLGLGRRNTDAEKLEKLLSFSKSIVEHESKLKDMLSTTGKYLTDKTISVRDSAFLDMLEDLSTMSNYLVDLMLIVAFALGEQDYLEDKRLKKFLGLKKDFNMLFTIYYNNIDKKLLAISKASSNAVNDLDKSHLDRNDSKLEVVISGFRGNPIYYVRKGWVDIEMWRIRVLQDKKSLFGAKLIELRALQDKQPTKDVSKQVEYYKQQIEKTEYKIYKLQEV